eukprot:9859-Heterococcus_DN1.PRE.1
MRACALAVCACLLVADSTAFVPPGASACRSSVCKSRVAHRRPLMLSAAGENGDALSAKGFGKDSSPQKVVKQSTRLLALAFTCNKCEGRNTYKVRCCELRALSCLPCSVTPHALYQVSTPQRLHAYAITSVAEARVRLCWQMFWNALIMHACASSFLSYPAC